MRVSQLIHAMDRDDYIIVNDGNKRITNGDTIVVLVEEQRKKGE